MSIDLLRCFGHFPWHFFVGGYSFSCVGKTKFSSLLWRAVAAFFPAINALRRTSGSTWDDAEISSEISRGNGSLLEFVIKRGGGGYLMFRTWARIETYLIDLFLQKLLGAGSFISFPHIDFASVDLSPLPCGAPAWSWFPILLLTCHTFLY